MITLTIGVFIAYLLAAGLFGFLFGILAKPFKDQVCQRQHVSPRNMLVSPRWFDVLFPALSKWIHRDDEWKRLALIGPFKVGHDHSTNYINAIKECRRVRQVGLKDAKEMVDKWRELPR